MVDTFTPAAQQLHVVGHRRRVLLRTLRRVHDAVDAGAEDGVDVVGRGEADRVDAGELARVAPFLLGAVHPHADQLEVGPTLDGADGDRADAAGGPHGHAHGSGWHAGPPGSGAAVASGCGLARRRQNVRCIVAVSRRGHSDTAEGEPVGERLEGKVCIVTGAAQGIGAAYARALAA